jgi:hypothetical protein
MNTLRGVMAYILLGAMLCACAATRAPPDPQVPSVDDFLGRGNELLLDLSQFGARIHSVDDSRIVIFSTSDLDDACTNPPRPNTTPPVVNPISLQLALAAAKLLNQDQAAGRTTLVVKCRPVGDSSAAGSGRQRP